MKRLYIILLMLSAYAGLQAQKIEHRFEEENLPEVLRYISSKMKGSHVHFIFDDLDGISITRTFKGQTPLEAVQLAVSAYPIRVTEDEGDIYVEYDKSITRDIVLHNVTVYGTDESVNLIQYMRKAMRFSVTCPQEKVYLHFDNTGYFMGETIWFKAYVINALLQERTNISQTLYVELVNPDGEVLKTQKLYIDNGEAKGSFKLEEMYTTGFYEIRAYTRYMLNWGSATAFSRVMPVFKAPKAEGDYTRLELDKFSYKKRHPSYREMDEDLLDPSVINNDENLLTAVRLPKGDVNVHFYPEGGSLVEDTPCRVAFTVNDSEGLHFNCSGRLIDAEGNTLKGVVTLEEGRGSFDIVPSDEPTFLELTTADKKKQRFMLPEVEQEGISLALNATRDDYVIANLSASYSMFNHLLGYTLMNQGRIVTCDTISCQRNMRLRFDRSTLPAGVNQLTVFDADGRIFAERLFFICPSEAQRASVQVSTSNPYLTPCGKVSLDIHTKPNSSISLSAMDVATLPNGRQGNALTWMLLASDLKGYIEHPEYYFEADDREHRARADMLMMVQGWRRYDWNLMAEKARFVKINPIEDKLYLDGKIVPKSRESVANVTLSCTLYNKEGLSLKGETTTDSVGNYAFEAPNMSGDWNLIFAFPDLGRKNSKYHIGINRNFSPQPRYISPYETLPQPELKANLFQYVPDSVYSTLELPTLMKREHQLPEVKVDAKRRIYENARASWENERQGKRWATIYYNVSKEVNNIIDRGEQAPPFFEWLYSRNPLFTGQGAERFIPQHEASNIELVEDNKNTVPSYTNEARIWSPEALYNAKKWKLGENPELVYASSNKKSRLYDDLDYKGRPIVWIINNGFSCVTSSSKIKFRANILRETIHDLPVFLEEVKSVYISEDPHAFQSYLISDDLESRGAVTIFVYVHNIDRNRYENLDLVKSAEYQPVRTHRLTYFEAYNDPSTFVMDDYSQLPLMEDFRRTIFWEPDIKTDENGNAHIEFYNNSSAKRLYISAEGLDREGRFLVNE